MTSRSGRPLLQDAGEREPAQLARVSHAAHGTKRTVGDPAIRQRSRHNYRRTVSAYLGTL